MAVPSTMPSRSSDRLLPPLVFIHGFKGSTLTDPQGNLRWLTWWQALGLASPDLRLPLVWNGDSDTQRRDDLAAKEPLRRVAWHDIYAPFLDWAEASGRAFYPFAYDWRRDNLESVRNFVAFLKTISGLHGGVKVQVAAHSMGGLISFVALNRSPDLFHSVLFAGVPFSPGISFLEDMHAGTATGLNKRILSPQVLFTFVSRYSFFPWETPESALVEQTGDSIPHDWYSADDWERQKLGIFAMTDAVQVTEQHRTHLRMALRRASEFRRLLVSKEEKSFQYPPVAVLASDRHPTLATVVRDGPRAVRGWDFHTAAKKPGDNRVEFPRAMPPEGVPYTVHKTAREHGYLLNDTRQVAAILAQLSE